jgi:hypothetical protein
MLTPEVFRLFVHRYGIEEDGNVAADPRGEFRDGNILYVRHSIEETAHFAGRPVEEVGMMLEEAREIVFARRETRPRPHLDDKIILSWNGLMISAFARAFQVLGSQEYLDAAERAHRFIRKHLFDTGTGTYYRRYRDGEAKYNAGLADYAFYAQGLIDLYEASFDCSVLEAAVECTEDALKLFYDDTSGGFFDTAGNDPTLLIRSKEEYDGAEPSGNSIEILNLLRLSVMTGGERYERLAQKSLAWFGSDVKQSPQSLPQLLVAVDWMLNKPLQFIIAARQRDSSVDELTQCIQARFMPRKTIILLGTETSRSFLTSRMPFLENIPIREDTLAVYLCEEYQCRLPQTDAAGLSQALDQVMETKNSL